MATGKAIVTTAALWLISSTPAEAANVLVDPATLLATAKRMDFVGRNEMAVVHADGDGVLRSTPNNSASGFYLKTVMDGRQLTDVRWTWRVDVLQPSADLRVLAREDSAAAIFFIFGEPSLFTHDVPTLAYVWTGTPVAVGTVFPSARFANLRYIKIEGTEAVGHWRDERRSITDDFRAAFHREPDTLRYIAVFNDNDQTHEPCSALFGPIMDAR